MKKLILTIVFIVLFAGACHFEHNYTRKECVVIQVCDGIASIEDKTGNIWDVEYKGLTKGQYVNLKMYDNLTSANIEDDIVKKVEVK